MGFMHHIGVSLILLMPLVFGQDIYLQGRPMDAVKEGIHYEPSRNVSDCYRSRDRQVNPGFSINPSFWQLLECEACNLTYCEMKQVDLIIINNTCYTVYKQSCDCAYDGNNPPVPIQPADCNCTRELCRTLLPPHGLAGQVLDKYITVKKDRQVAENPDKRYCKTERLGTSFQADRTTGICRIQYTRDCTCVRIHDGSIIPNSLLTPLCTDCSTDICELDCEGNCLPKTGFTQRPFEDCVKLCLPSGSGREKRAIFDCTYDRDCVFTNTCCDGYTAACIDPNANTTMSHGAATCYTAEEGCCARNDCCTGVDCMPA